MPFSWFLALRYLKPKNSAFSIITLISIIGVALGVGVLIVVIGVMSGFDRMIKESILGLEPQIVLHQVWDPQTGPEAEQFTPMERGQDWRKTKELLAAHPLVKSIHPYIYLTTLIEPTEPLIPGGNTEPQAAHFLGLSPDNTDQIEKIKQKMVKGAAGGEFLIGGESVVLNDELAQKMGVQVGGKINAFSPESIKQIRMAWKKREDAKTANKPEEVKALDEQMDVLLAPTEFTVSGIFTSQQHKDHVILALDDAQVLNGDSKADRISSLAINTDDPFKAEERLKELVRSGSWPENWRGHTWVDSHRDFFTAIQNERSMMFLILMVIVLVAAFCTTISMIIFAVQKRREIGMLRALGARFSQILQIFAAQGSIVGFFGVMTGTLAGLAILKWRNELRNFLSDTFSLEIFPANVYGLPSLPAYLRNEDLYSICIPAFLLCAVAALLPAMFSFRDDPAKALRGER